MTRDEYEAMRKEYRALVAKMDAANARRDFRKRAALAVKAVPLEDAMNAYEAEHAEAS